MRQEKRKAGSIAEGTRPTRDWGLAGAAMAVFALAAVVRFVYLAQSGSFPTFGVPIVDAGTYDLLARNLISGKGQVDLFWQPLFYPLWLAAVYKLGGGILAVKILQMLLGSCTCVMVFLLGARFIGRKGGLLAGIIAAVYMPMVFLEGELLATGWECFWFVTLAYLSLVARQRRSGWLCLLLGICSILAVLTRANFVVVVIAWWGWLIWTWARERLGVRAVLLVACGMAGLATLALPIAAWNYKVQGRFSVLPHSGGINMYIGNNPDWERTVMVRPGTQWRELTELPLKEGIKDKAGANRWFYTKVRQYIAVHTGSFIKGLGLKAAQFVSSREIPRNVDIYLYRQWSGLLAAGVWKVGPFGFPFGVLLPLAAVGAWRWRSSIPWPVWMAAASYAASIIVVFVASRYRMPVLPVLCISAAGGAMAIAEMVRLKKWSSVALVALAMAAIGAGASVAGPFAQEKYDYRSEMYFELGNSLRDRGRSADAEKAYAQAIELRPEYADAHADLAGLLKDTGAPRQAIEHYEAAIRYGLHKSDAEAGLGEALVRENRLDEAMEHFRNAVALDADNGKAHNNLGNLLAMRGMPADAIPQFQEALRLKPGDARTLNNLANALAATGNYAEAEQTYRQSISAEPTSPGTHYNLAVCLQKEKKLADAAAELAETLRLDPGYAKARAALESLNRQLQPAR
jgi:tetratricopeptide (TPR) repeat protein